MKLNLLIFVILQGENNQIQLPDNKVKDGGSKQSQGAASQAPTPATVVTTTALPILSKLGVRHLHVLMTAFAITIAYMARVNLSVAIVAMTSEEQTDSRFPVYDWDEEKKSQILSSFFWGYIIPQILAGNMAEKFGAWGLLFGAMVVTAITTVIVPFVAKYGYFVVCLSRVSLGLCQGIFFPCCTALLSKWIPPAERISSFAFTFSGSNAGPLIGLLLSGYLAASSGGWPSIFYTIGGISVAWSILWFLVGANTPQEHRFIGSAEKEFIVEALTAESSNDTVKTSKKTPWFDIFTSLPVWAIIICHSTHNWGFWVLATQMPNYIDSILGVDIEQNGLISCLPYLAGLITSIVFPLTATKVSQLNLISPTTHRKIWNSIAEWGAALCLIFLAFVKTHSVVLVVFSTVTALALNSGCMTGFLTNHVELSLNFCGTLMGITNSLSSVGSILGPLSVGWLVKEKTSEEQWSLVFYLSGGIMFLGNLVYLIFGSSKIQHWNED